jgi:para-nitrobenzyl esterase
MTRWLLGLGTLLILTGWLLGRLEQSPAPAEATLVADPGSVRITTAGPVVGGIGTAGAFSWRGIPYAAAPVGERRWRAPFLPEPWSELRPALVSGPVCPQLPSALSQSGGAAGGVLGQEDCLTLDIHAPQQDPDAPLLPVMVWIHGGGNSIGTGASYDAGRLAVEENVVVVSINYRLGLLGWLGHEALRAGARGPAEASGNFALLDMLRALEWVQFNIAGFAGDPDRVTVFGESAGGRNIMGLLASPLAEGLFHRAIVQSGSIATYTRDRAENYADDPQPGARLSSGELLLSWLQATGRAQDRAAARRLADELSTEAIATFLRSLPLDVLFSAVAEEDGMYRAPQLLRDGHVLPRDSLLSRFESADGWNRVPLLLGSNRDEMKLFLALDPEHVRRWFGVVPRIRDRARYNLLASYHSDRWKALSVDEVATRVLAQPEAPPVYTYRFDWDDSRDSIWADLPALLGAAHALELDFLFQPLLADRLPGLATEDNRAGREALGLAMRAYWAAFARDGDPGTGGVASGWPDWPARSPVNANLMLLDSPSAGGPRVVQASLDALSIARRLAADSALEPGPFRCALYVDLFLDDSGNTDFFSRDTYRALGCEGFPPWSLQGGSL